MDIGIISPKYPVGLKHDAGRAVCSFAAGLAALGHRVTVYTYNGSRMTMKYYEGTVKNLQIVSVGVIATKPIKSGLIYEDTETWNDGVWDELENQDTTKVLLVFDWFGFDAASAHREMYKSCIIGVVGTLASGRGQFIPFTDAVKLAAYKSKELEFLTQSDALVTFNRCSAIEVGKLSNVPCTTISLGISPMENPDHKTVPGNVLVVGRISREKVLEALLRSIKDLYWVELTLWGTGKETDYGTYISKLAGKLDVADRVVFVDRADDCYSKAEIVVCPSIYDPFGYQVLDAYNHCVPVIGHFMSYSDLIKNKDTGYSYQSIGDLAKNLELLHNSSALRKQLTVSAKAELMENYTTSRSIERMDHYLMHITDGVYAK